MSLLGRGDYDEFAAPAEAGAGLSEKLTEAQYRYHGGESSRAGGRNWPG
jgi:hypothetical protein